MPWTVFGDTVVWMLQFGLCVWVHCGLNVAGWQSHGVCLGTLVCMLQVYKDMECVWVHCGLNDAGWALCLGTMWSECCRLTKLWTVFGYTVVWMLQVGLCVWVQCGLNVALRQSHGLCLCTLWSECCSLTKPWTVCWVNWSVCCRLAKPWAVCLGTLWSECCRLTKPWTVCLGTPWHMTSVPETGSSRMGDNFCWARLWMGSVLWDLPLWWRKIWRVGYCAFQSLTSEDIKLHIITKTAWH